MKEQVLAELVKKEELKKDIIKFSVKAPEIVQKAKPGNFIEVRINNQTVPFLRRPISIYNMEKEEGILEFVFQIKGEGTELLAKKEIGDKIDIIGPLGYGTFKYDKTDSLAIIGGGIGVFPLYELAKSAKLEGKKVSTYLGFRNEEMVVLEKEFQDVSDRIVIATDDGSYAKSGFAIDYLKEDIEKGKVSAIYACGPLPMLKAVRDIAIEKDIFCQISLEERMGCGLGVCLGCAVKIAKSPEDNPEYWHVCMAGPVFQAKEVEI